jgi:tryptophan halogenase
MNIVIVGGGTAGWLTAGLLLSKYPNIHKVTIIESTKIGIIGVGEATTGYFTDVLVHDLKCLGIDHDEFIVETGSNIKYGIKHKGWTPDLNQSYFAPIDGSYTSTESPDFFFAYALGQLGKDKLTSITTLGHLYDQDMSNFGTHKKFMKHIHALQVDAQLVGKYLRKKILERTDAVHIDDQITKVNLNEQGFIKSIQLEGGNIVEGDFFIDCSGFSRVLMKQLEGSSWTSYKKHLPVDSAFPFLLQYKEGERPEPYILAHAQSSGWMWRTSLLDRTGNGYIYDSNFITQDKAQEEIETVLGRKIEPLKQFKFESGRQTNAWVKNCVAIGISYAFLEPLESTSIHSTIVQIKNFLDYLRPTFEDTMNEGSMKFYNQRTAKSYDELVNFLVLHYMGGRTDTEFWRYIATGETKTEFVSDLLEMCKTRMPNRNDFPIYFGSAGWPLYSYVLAGTNNLLPEVANKELYNIAREDYNMTVEGYNRFKSNMHSNDGMLYSIDKFIAYFKKLRLDKGFK